MENGKIIRFMEEVNFFLKMGLIMRVLFIMGKPQDRGVTFIIMDAFMKVNLKIMMLTVLAFIMILFKGITIQDNGSQIRLLGKVNKNLLTDLIIKDFLCMD